MLSAKFKKISKKTLNSQQFYYWLSFLIPTIAFFAYFACNNFNILTVDLGQQYVDFFAFLRRNLFSHPLELIYSFNNGMGNSMIASNAYYLLSPFNLLIFLFSPGNIPIAILTIISIKIGACGLSGYYYWKKQDIEPFYALAASIAYALSGYVIANHFNLMWLDSIILLPLLINAINQILNKEKNHLILVTFGLWVTNFYTGIMALFFGFLYFLSKIFFVKKGERWTIVKNYLGKSILASFLSAFVLLPTFFELLSGKANSSVNWNLSWQFNAPDQLSKLIDGAYNFHEMEAGLPNIFMTMPFLLFLIAYFLSKKIAWQNKLVNGILLLFLLLSLIFTPLVLLWHLGQFPIWYPARFSFVLIFFCLDLGIIFLKNEHGLTWPSKIILAILSLGLVCCWTFLQNNFAFITDTNLIVSSAFIVISLLFIFFIFTHHAFAGIFLYSVVVAEAIISMVLSLNNLSYQENYDFKNYLENTTLLTQNLNKKDHILFRTEKNFYRSDDDPFTSNYNGITNFNSITNAKVLNLLANLGYLHNSNSVTNNGGTPLTESLLGIKYYIEPNYDRGEFSKKKQLIFNNNIHRLDLDNYPIISDYSQLALLKNNEALPLTFLIKENTNKTKFVQDNPVYNQELLFQRITGSKQKLFKNIDWPDPQTHGVNAWPGSWMQYDRKKHAKQSTISFNLPIDYNGSYYLELPNGVDENLIDLFINNQQVDFVTRDGQNRLINIANNNKGRNVKISFTLKENNLNLNTANIWCLNTIKMNRILTRFNQKQPRTYQKNSLVLQTSTFKIKENKIFASSIPYSPNWFIFDHGKLVHKRLFANTFLSTKLAQGTHRLTFVYLPIAFLIGILISLISLVYLKLHLD
ncbi:ABC superfamily ATP binding cassette transporter [Lactobacillus hamsteri DSM 5661 = JCM 6256]|uniref:ABC superfamily ATP binding cassette transporter n=2 Tax=Lactobacillus hamsteri TaxID=96565 RepID=A0A0R1YD29_9LACO|nr:YfhO family protein [Lactobacillus hamsteri]KRM40350.1 ABC superfamily ATP binding cassette transporter [Lactobacillus hamsteri DSM 5661 = JCM 6256]